jgi:hypothetical protein
LGKALRGVACFSRQRETAFEQHKLVDALGERRGEQHRDGGAARVAKQRAARPLELVGHIEQIADVLPEVVRGVRGARAAQAVAGEIERDDFAAGQERRKQLEAAGVIEPAV